MAEAKTYTVNDKEVPLFAGDKKIKAEFILKWKGENPNPTGKPEAIAKKIAAAIGLPVTVEDLEKVETLNKLRSAASANIGQIAKSQIVAWWLENHDDKSMTGKDKAEAIEKWVGDLLPFKFTQNDVSQAKAKSGSSQTAKPVKGVSNGELHELIKFAKAKMGVDSKEELLNQIENVEFCWATFLITKLGTKTNAIEAVKNWQEKTSPTIFDPLA